MHLFFYGTLLDGSDNAMAREVHRLVNPLGAATLRGKLLAVPDPQGWFPALIAGEETVHGGLYEATSALSPAELARLDAYEDYDPLNPAASLYLRAAMQVTDAKGAAVMADVYLYNQLLPPGSCAIPSGDFRQWISASGEAPFAGRRSENSGTT